MKRFILVILCLLAFPVVASHIVGGEFEILYVSGNTYRINLIIYFDLQNGAIGARDPAVNARIYRKRDNAIMRSEVYLPLTNETPVAYTQPECSVGGVSTSKLIYTTTMQMTPQEFNDPDGYYIVWERCCRNYNTNKLLNIVSIDPQNNPNNPNAAGQTFYLEFPPVIKDGQPFINSSPQLFPPLSDYACINKPYYTDFAGTDIDGDSLSYTIVTPLNTHTSEAIPAGGPKPAPFPVVKWKFPYSIDNILGGNPDLKISRDGLLTVKTGSVEGLFVFAVKCEEFRGGVKIGELRRDFQMYVLDCAEADPPQITARKLGETSFAYDNTMAVAFPNTVSDENRCIEVRVTDPDALRYPEERIRLRAIPIGFKKDVSAVLPEITSTILTADNNEKIFRICFDRCPMVKGPYQIGIIAADDACSLPLLDTIKITVNIQPPTNAPATFSTPDVTETLVEGTQKSWPILGIDPDQDSIAVQISTDGFVLADAGISIEQIRLEDGTYEARLLWDANCRIYDYTQRTDFKVKISIDDVDECEFEEPDVMLFNLHIDLPDNKKPVIGSNLSFIESQNGIERKLYKLINFGVFGTDADKDELTLSVIGEGFKIEDYDISFPSATANSLVSSKFAWTPTCDKVDLSKKDEFLFTFIVKEKPNYCGISEADSLQVKILLVPPDNNAPDLIVTSLNPEVPLIGNQLSMIMGQEVSLNLSSTDPDVNPQDQVNIELIDATGNVEPVGYQFTPAQGIGSAQTTFMWKPTCEIYQNKIYENDYTFRFRTTDNRCSASITDTVEVALKVKDIDGGYSEFIPPNFITPNGDACNDFFAMEGIEEGGCGEVNIPNLPKDNCIGQFTSIKVYNRWGKQVFQSTRRDFRWYPSNEAAGVYFYTIQYTNTEYKGSVTIRF
jgi:hypothetical protein